MNSIVDRVILLLFATLCSLLHHDPILIILPLLITITITSINEFFTKEKLALAFVCGYLFLCLLNPAFLLFLPVLLYDVFMTKYQYIGFVGLVPLFIFLEEYALSETIIWLCIVAVAFWLRRKTVQYMNLHQQYISQRDSLTELSLTLKNKIAELTQKQDDDVMLATLNERNRIARDIHDNVGHLLTSSILQLGALISVTHDESMKESLAVLKNTLSKGMDSIRSSVHNLQDDSVDLYAQINHIVKEFTFCKSDLIYDMSDNIPIQIRYAIIAIAKEAFANIIKHSNATQVTVSLYEHPKLYQLIILDNGTKISPINTNGIGLENMKQRVAALNGIIHISNTNGFRIFVSFPKETSANY